MGLWNSLGLDNLFRLGSNNFWTGLGKGFGTGLNNFTGVTTSAKQQYKHQLALQHDAQNFAKWQMENAHQTEVQDLQNAGLNPVLSAGGQGASAGVSMGTAQQGTGMDPTSLASNIVGAINSSKQTDANVENLDANSALQTAQAWQILKTTEPDIERTLAERAKLEQDAKESKSREDLNKAQQALAEWDARHPVLSKILPGSIGAAASLGGTAIMGTALKAGQAAKAANSAKTTVKNSYNSRGAFTGSTVTTRQ